MCQIILGNDQEPGGSLVDAVDNAGALFPADAGETVAAVVQQCVDKRPVRMPRCGMHDHTTRFIDHNDVAVFKYNLQRNGLRDQFRVRNIGKGDKKAFAFCHPVIFFHCLIVCRKNNRTGLQKPLCGVSGQSGNGRCQKGVCTFTGCCGGEK